MTAAPMAFSVVVPTYRRRDSLERVLTTLGRQQWPAGDMEVLVVCDGDEDGSVEMARSLRLPFATRVLEQSNQGPAAARNLGVATAANPFVLFLDDDVVPSPTLLAEHARAHDGAQNRVVIGPLVEPPDSLLPWVRWECRTLAEQYRAMAAGEWAPTPWQLYTGNASLRVEHVRNAGGFDAAFKRAEDVELGFRLEALGCEFVFNPAAVGLHYAERSYRVWLDVGYQYGRNDVLFGKTEERAVAEFQHRHPLTKALVRWGLRHPAAARRHLLPRGKGAIELAHRLRLGRLSDQICGGIFNLSYWLGVGDQLGSPRTALDLIQRKESSE
jgi:GT2 family glycosyltransferase